MKRLFATRPSRSSIILAIEDNPCLLHDDLLGDQFADRPYDAELADVDQQPCRPATRAANGGPVKEVGELEATTIVIVGAHGECLGNHGERAHGMTL